MLSFFTISCFKTEKKKAPEEKRVKDDIIPFLQRIRSEVIRRKRKGGRKMSPDGRLIESRMMATICGDTDECQKKTSFDTYNAKYGRGVSKSGSFLPLCLLRDT